MKMHVIIRNNLLWVIIYFLTITESRHRDLVTWRSSRDQRLYILYSEARGFTLDSSNTTVGDKNLTIHQITASGWVLFAIYTPPLPPRPAYRPPLYRCLIISLFHFMYTRNGFPENDGGRKVNYGWQQSHAMLLEIATDLDVALYDLWPTKLVGTRSIIIRS